MEDHTPRWRVPPAAYVPIGLAIVAEAISNGLRAYGLGANLEAFTVPVSDVPVSLAGAVLVVAAGAVSISQARAAWAMCAPGPWQRRVIGAAFTVLLVSVSVTALRCHIEDAENAKLASSGKAETSYQSAKDAYQRASEEYAKVKDADTPAAVQAQMAAVPIDAAIRRRTKNCTDVTTKVSQRECSKVTALLPDLARARRKAEIEAKLPKLKDDLDRQKPGEAKAADAKVVGFWGWLMGLGVVLVATFGAVLFAETERAPEAGPAPKADSDIPKTPKSEPPTPKKGRGGRKADAKIVNFIAAWERGHGRRPTGSEIRAYFPDLPASTAYDYAKRTG